MVDNVKNCLTLLLMYLKSYLVLLMSIGQHTQKLWSITVCLRGQINE